MKIINFIIVFFFLLIFTFCKKQPTQTKIDTQKNINRTDILFKIQIPPEIQTYVYSSYALVTALDMDTIKTILAVSETQVEGTIKNVPAGKDRYFEIFVFNQDSMLTYYGSKYAEVYAGFVNQVEIMLQAVIETGIVVLFGYFDIPSREKIVYSTFDFQLPFDDGEIYLLNVGEKKITQLTNNPGADYHPQFSPQGDKIVFVRNLDPMGHDSHIFIMNIDGSEQHQLTYPPVKEDAPCFSPNGDQIVFRKTTENGLSNLFVINVDGSGSVNITNNEINVLHPTWPNNGYIYFVTHGSDNRIWQIRPDGSELMVVSPFKIGAHERIKFTSDMQNIFYDSYEYPNQIIKSSFPLFNNSIAITLGDDTGGFCLSPQNDKIIFSQGSHSKGYYLYIKDFNSNEIDSLGIRAIHMDWKKISN